MAFIETPQISIEDLINYLNQFPKDAIVCTHTIVTLGILDK